MLRAIRSYYFIFFVVAFFCFIHVCLSSILFRRFFISPRVVISFSLEVCSCGWLVSARSLLVLCGLLTSSTKAWAALFM